jgi:hypothetical protein
VQTKFTDLERRALDGADEDPDRAIADVNPERNPVGRTDGGIHRVLELLRELLAQERPLMIGHGHVLNGVLMPGGILGAEVERAEVYHVVGLVVPPVKCDP